MHTENIPSLEFRREILGVACSEGGWTALTGDAELTYELFPQHCSLGKEGHQWSCVCFCDLEGSRGSWKFGIYAVLSLPSLPPPSSCLE